MRENDLAGIIVERAGHDERGRGDLAQRCAALNDCGDGLSRRAAVTGKGAGYRRARDKSDCSHRKSGTDARNKQ